MAKVLLASFSHERHADAAVTELQEEGFDTTDISIITKERKELHRASDDATTDMAEGATAGAGTGAAVGGIAGLLAGAGVFPALAGLFIGGPIAVALGLTGVAAATVSGAVTGAVAGGLIGALTNLGVSEETARAYEEVVNEGGVVIGVPVDETEDEDLDARVILESHGAEDITEVDMKK